MSEAVSLYLWIGLGSGLGGMGRFWLSGFVANRFGETFPWGTLFVNASGSLLIGFLAAVTGPDGRILWSPRLSQFFLAGVCGGYTTFSSFSLQTLNLLRSDQWLAAGVNAVLSVLACLVAVWLGYALGQLLNR